MTAWVDVARALNGILDRRWYTNHGPMAQALEARLRGVLGVRHAVAVTNPTIGLVMLAEGLALARGGGVLVSALAPRRCLQSLVWAGLRPVVCDVDPGTFGLTVETVARCAGSGCGAVLSASDADADGLAVWAAARGLAFYRDGVSGGGPAMVVVPGVGDDAGAACVVTDDDGLAARLRNIRSSYGAGTAVAVVRTANGRLSEAQAAMALLELDGGSVGAWLDGVRAGLRGWRLLGVGSGLAMVADDGEQRGRIAAALMAVGARAGDLGLAWGDGWTVDCPVANGVAGRAVLLPGHVDAAVVCAAVRGA